jgi:hypothetical protein
MIFIGPTYYQRLKHLVVDKQHCLTMDHEVLTINGWKTYNELTLEDKIATLQNDKLVYSNPTHLHYYPEYSGKLYSISNSLIDLKVTENHRMWVSKVYGRKKEWLPYDFVEAKNLVGKRIKYKKDAEWIKDDYQFILPSTMVHNGYEEVEHPSIKVNMDAWLTFFGIWIAEGWANVSRKDNHGYIISVSVNKQRVKDALYPSLELLGYNYRVNNEKLSITNKQLWDYMKDFSLGAPNKVLPTWVFELSKNQTIKLIESMILGDGFYGRNPTLYSYYTSSTKLADQFQQLCLHAGWSSIKHLHFKQGENITYIEGREVTNNYDLWRLSVIKTKNRPEVNHAHVKEQKIQEESFEDWKGPVFCVSVPGEVFYVRRNGKTVWTGNSRNLGPLQNLVRQPTEGRSKEGGLRFGEINFLSLRVGMQILC